jgi:hypothetical protein
MRCATKLTVMEPLSRPAGTMLDAARALADYMMADEGDLEHIGYTERQQVMGTLRVLITARKEELNAQV